MQDNYFTKPGWSVKEVNPAEYVVSFASRLQTVDYRSLGEAIVKYRMTYGINGPVDLESVGELAGELRRRRSTSVSGGDGGGCGGASGGCGGASGGCCAS